MEGLRYGQVGGGLVGYGIDGVRGILEVMGIIFYLFYTIYLYGSCHLLSLC